MERKERINNLLNYIDDLDYYDNWEWTSYDEIYDFETDQDRYERLIEERVEKIKDFLDDND